MEQLNLDRRGFLRGAAALGALAAFTPMAVNGVETAAAAPAERLVLGRPVDSDNLDPVTCIGNVNIFVFNLVVEGLVKTSDDGSGIEPCLATDWETSEDGLTWTFHVMEGLTFSDGSPVTAEDWQWTFDRAIETTDSHWWSCVSNIDHVECPDDTTVIVVCKQAAASTLANLCIFDLGVQSKAYYDKVGADEYMNGPIGTGPYMISEWKKGEYITFAANPNYRDSSIPLTKEVEFKVVADDEARSIQLRGNDIQMAESLSFSTMSQLESDASIVVSPNPATMVYWISLNTENEYLKDVEVRKALYMATGAQDFVNAVSYGYATPAGSVVNPSSEYCNHDLQAPVQDIEGAKAKLAEAGYPDGFKLRLLLRGGNATYEQIAAVLQYQWSQVGVTVEFDTRESTAYSQARKDMDLDIIISGWSDDVIDPTSLMQFIFDFDTNCGYYTNFHQPEDLVAKNDQATVELDVEKRKELYAEIQQSFLDNGLYIPIMCVPWQNAYRAGVEGFIQTPLGNYRFENLAMEA